MEVGYAKVVGPESIRFYTATYKSLGRSNTTGAIYQIIPGSGGFHYRFREAVKLIAGSHDVIEAEHIQQES